MNYELFLFDLDDTLLDFQASERRSFQQAMEKFGLDSIDALYATYQQENKRLWDQYERGEMTKDLLRTERFRRMAEIHALTLDTAALSDTYLGLLPQTVVLIDHAVELCEWLSKHGEIGIVTNGIQDTQMQRIANSALAPYISFICVSDACGYAKPDVRIFEHSGRMAKKFAKHTTLVMGDRLDADILGAHRFGVDSCWFNPQRQARPADFTAKYEIAHLSELRELLTPMQAKAC